MRTIIALSVLMVGCTHALPVENYAITETYRVCETDKSSSKENWSIVCERVTRTTYADGRQVTVKQLPGVTVVGQPVQGSVEVQEPVIHTWLTKEDLERMAADNLRKAMEEAVRNDPCKCANGDPLCACIKRTP
jgi:hypothetical protein